MHIQQQPSRTCSPASLQSIWQLPSYFAVVVIVVSLCFIFPTSNFPLHNWESILYKAKKGHSAFWDYASVQDFQRGGLPGAALTDQREC